VAVEQIEAELEGDQENARHDSDSGWILCAVDLDIDHVLPLVQGAVILGQGLPSQSLSAIRAPPLG